MQNITFQIPPPQSSDVGLTPPHLTRLAALQLERDNTSAAMAGVDAQIAPLRARQGELLDRYIKLTQEIAAELDRIRADTLARQQGAAR